ncbi:MAG: hypothetical protein Q8P89_03605 [bacterium]|nr:hypothetical protein [bacterium]
MSGRLEVKPPSNGDFFRFTVAVPPDDAASLRTAFRDLFPDGRIVFDQQQELLKRKRFNSRIDEKNADFLAPKDPGTEAKIIVNFRRFFHHAFNSPTTEVTNFQPLTQESLPDVKVILHNFLLSCRLTPRQVVVTLESAGLIDGHKKNLKEMTTALGLSVYQATYAKRIAIGKIRACPRQALEESNLVTIIDFKRIE